MHEHSLTHTYCRCSHRVGRPELSTWQVDMVLCLFFFDRNILYRSLTLRTPTFELAFGWEKRDVFGTTVAWVSVAAWISWSVARTWKTQVVVHSSGACLLCRENNRQFSWNVWREFFLFSQRDDYRSNFKVETNTPKISSYHIPILRDVTVLCLVWSRKRDHRCLVSAFRTLKNGMRL